MESNSQFSNNFGSIKLLNALRHFLIELLFCKMKKLSSLAVLELEISYHIDFSRLHVLAKTHNSLKTVYMNICYKVFDESIRSTIPEQKAQK